MYAIQFMQLSATSSFFLPLASTQLTVSGVSAVGVVSAVGMVSVVSLISSVSIGGMLSSVLVIYVYARTDCFLLALYSVLYLPKK